MAPLAREARFSKDRRYRYTLEIQVEKKNNTVIQFIGLNPSTADETNDDATMRRLKRFTKDWGYGWLIMTNLFAYRTHHPEIMKSMIAPIGMYNDRWLQHTAENVDLIVCCWGNHGVWLNRNKNVEALLMHYDLYCFATSRDGHPMHPLRLPATLTPIKFRERVP